MKLNKFAASRAFLMTDNPAHTESLVMDLLLKHSYYNVGKNGRFITADSALRNMLLLVISEVAPAKPHQPKSDDVEYLKVKAKELKREPWVALISVSDRQIIGQIQWFNYANR